MEVYTTGFIFVLNIFDKFWEMVMFLEILVNYRVCISFAFNIRKKFRIFLAKDERILHFKKMIKFCINCKNIVNLTSDLFSL